MEHKELTVWKKAMEITTSIYHLTNRFPRNEKFGLISQIQRSAVSIPSNIAEGSARNSDKECIHHLYIALGSLAEVETQLFIARNLRYLKDISKTLEELTTVKRLIIGLIKYLRNKSL